MNGAIDACSRARPTRLDDAFRIFEHTLHETTTTATETSKTDSGGLKPNVFTFGALMNACNRARDADRAIKLLRSMEQDYGVSPNAVVYSSCISACARSIPPKPDLALKLLKEVVEEKQLAMSVVGFNAAISACAQASEWENAIYLLSRMEEAALNNTSNFLVPEPDLVTYGTVLAACERAEQWKTILKYAKSMQEKGLAFDGLSIMSCLHACAELGLAYEALNYLNMMKSVDPVAPQTARLERSGARKPLVGPDAVAYRCAIAACARGGAWKEGIRLLKECKDVTGTPANVVAYTAAITGCEYAGEWKQAFFLLEKMRKEGVKPNEMTMCAVIGACANACAKEEREGDDDTGMHVAQKKALQLLNVLKKDPSVVKPNIQIYNAAIRVCAEANDVRGAFRILEEIKASGIERTEITYGTLMTACERVGCVEDASKAFRMMKEDDIQPNEIIYGAAISCCRKAREPERALLLLKKMIKEGLSPNAACLNTVLIAQTDAKKTSDSEKVLHLFKLMKSDFVQEDGRPNRQTFNILINFFAATKQPATAEAFLDKMRQDGFKPDVDLFTATVSAYERTQQPLKAVKLMQRMQDDGYDFYSVKVLNSAFKKAVNLVNAVGQNFATQSDDETILLDSIIESDDDRVGMVQD
jgi:pentatricopeptide repeat domain-containing protein 1